MNQRHKHYDMIVAWAEGKKMQFSDQFYNSGNWEDIVGNPAWDTDVQYRIKPETIRCKRYLVNSKLDNTPIIFCCNLFGCSEDKMQVYIENKPEFRRWIDTEWQEVEV